jgi:hypothetical protein
VGVDEFELTRTEVEQLADENVDIHIQRESDSGETYGFVHSTHWETGTEYDTTPHASNWGALLSGKKDGIEWDAIGVRVTVAEESEDADSEPKLPATLLIEILEKCDHADELAKAKLEHRGYEIEQAVFDKSGNRKLPPL